MDTNEKNYCLLSKDDLRLQEVGLRLPEIILYRRIAAFFEGNGKDVCYAPNSWFADFLCCDERSIQRYLLTLKNIGLIKMYSETDSFNMTNRTIYIKEEVYDDLLEKSNEELKKKKEKKKSKKKKTGGDNTVTPPRQLCHEGTTNRALGATALSPNNREEQNNRKEQILQSDLDEPKSDFSVDDFPSENISANTMCEGDFYIECSDDPSDCIQENIEVVHPNDFEEAPEVDYQELECNSFELDPIVEEENKLTIKEIDSDWDGLVDSIAETETKIINFPFDRIYHRVISGISDGIITNENLIHAVNNCLKNGIRKDEIPFIIKNILDSSSIDNIDAKIQCCINLYEENLLATN